MAKLRVLELLILLWINFDIVVRADTPINVTTKLGIVTGEVETMSNGFEMQTFRSVPYAQSPSLRFSKPVSLTQFSSPYDATVMKPDCARWSTDGKTLDPSSSEDCLYLTILVPYHLTGFIPVIFWIQQGGLSNGGTSDYDIEAIGINFVSKGVIVVLVNHRQGPFGFFTTGTDDCQGNLGVWDTLEALKFVHNNINAFGGDATQITTMGVESGAVMVELLSLTPMARGLFQSMIMMGGSVFDPAICRNDTANLMRSQQLALALGCDSASQNLWNNGQRAQVLKCLQGISTDKLVSAISLSDVKQRLPWCIKCNYFWRPRRDGPNGLFPDTFENLAGQRPLTPAILGVMHRDWLADLLPFIYDGSELLPTNFNSTYNIPDFPASTCQNLMSRDIYGTSLYDTLVAQCIDHFVNHSNYDEPYYWAHRAGTITTTYHVTAPIYKTTALMKQRHNWRIFVYSFEYNRADISQYWQATGASRYLDVTLMANYNPSFAFNDEDCEVASLFSDMLVNFVKYHNPTPLCFTKINVQWERFGAENPFLIFDTADTSEIGEHEKESDCMFWINNKALDEN